VAAERYNNRLLQLCSPDDVAALGKLERVSLSMRERFPDVDGEGAYFIEDGVASIIIDVGEKMPVELGIVGREGMVGLAAVYGDPTEPLRAVMQVAGIALRCDASALRQTLQERSAMRQVLLNFARAFTIQVATTALANGRSKLDERLARWLLMVADRVGPSFPITHEFISIMLGVRRSGVTLAIQMLEGDGLIRAHRGSITILDRPGLVQIANGAYGFAEQHYERLLGLSRGHVTA
jgi:CRP-like cAMP-binding protein